MSDRAAAYTHIGQFSIAINDCLKALEIDPNYWKAYSRLGNAYYGMARFADAIEKGYKKGRHYFVDSLNEKNLVLYYELMLFLESNSLDLWNHALGVLVDLIEDTILLSFFLKTALSCVLLDLNIRHSFLSLGKLCVVYWMWNFSQEEVQWFFSENQLEKDSVVDCCSRIFLHMLVWVLVRSIV